MDCIDGDIVRIDVTKILERQKEMNEDFGQFLRNSEDIEFTAELEKGHITMYTLKEDTTSPKWLFYIDDLIVVKEF